MMVYDFNNQQSRFRSFRFIPSNTTRLAPFPLNGDTRVHGSAKARRVPAMIAQADLDNLSGPLHAHALILRFNSE